MAEVNVGTAEVVEDSIEYEEFLKKARETNLEDIEVLEYIDTSNVDYDGRPLVVIYGKRLNVFEVDMEKMFLHFITQMDEITRGPFTVVYFNSKVGINNLPTLPWMVRMYRRLPYRYRKNVEKFSIVHPTVTTRLMSYTMYPFLSSKAWKKLYFADHVDELHLDKVTAEGVVTIPQEAVDAQQETEQYLEDTQKAFNQGMMR